MSKIERYQPTEQITIEVKRITDVIDGINRGIIIETDFEKGSDIFVRITKMNSPGAISFFGENIPILQKMLQEFMEALESIDD